MIDYSNIPALMVGNNSASTEVIRGKYKSASASAQHCTTDRAYSVLTKRSKIECAAPCVGQFYCREYTFDETTKACSIYYHKRVYTEPRPGCYGYKARLFLNSTMFLNVSD